MSTEFPVPLPCHSFPNQYLTRVNLGVNLLAKHEDIVVPKKKTSDENFHFENALQELETLVETLEEGDLSLEDSLKQFERGVALTRSCQKALNEAEQKVQVLLEKNGETSLDDFETDGQ